MKTFKIATQGGSKEVEHLGTFAYYIKNIQFRFVITREAPSLPPVVTHRMSGRRVVEIKYLEQAASLGDVVGAGRLALDHLIDRVGADRLFDVLRRAEDQNNC